MATLSSIGICQKDWMQTGLDGLLDHHLSYSICYGGHAQNPFASRLLGMAEGADGT